MNSVVVAATATARLYLYYAYTILASVALDPFTGPAPFFPILYLYPIYIHSIIYVYVNEGLLSLRLRLVPPTRHHLL